MSGSAGRIAALVRRHLYLLGSSWTRLAEIAYWPTVQMLTWGFGSGQFELSWLAASRFR